MTVKNANKVLEFKTGVCDNIHDFIRWQNFDKILPFCDIDLSIEDCKKFVDIMCNREGNRRSQSDVHIAQLEAIKEWEEIVGPSEFLSDLHTFYDSNSRLQNKKEFLN